MNESRFLRLVLGLIGLPFALATPATADSPTTAAQVESASAVIVHPLASASAQGLLPAVVPFANPDPGYLDFFGSSVAAVGADKVLIGTPETSILSTGGGEAFLFSTNGTLLTTFTNPSPAGIGLFGRSVAALGSGRVLVGAPQNDTGAKDAGEAYLFSIAGELLATFTNPTPAPDDYFGAAVAAVGTDRVLIGAYWDDTVGNDAGAAYLFNTNGVLLRTFTKPTPRIVKHFGYSVVALGKDRVLIGADGGGVCLFSIDGALLTVITNPPSARSYGFGWSVAAVGYSRVLIGAPHDNASVTDTGAAYLFSTNGALLTVFTNPTPAVNDSFGESVTAVGDDRVLIGAYLDDTAATDAGAAYLFSVDGTLLATLTSSNKTTPLTKNWFGRSVAAVGEDRVLIGAYGEDSSSGAAYLFHLAPFAPQPPMLSIARDPEAASLTLSWPAWTEGWDLERANALGTEPATSWLPVMPPYQMIGATVSATLPASHTEDVQFFRLTKP